MTEALRAVLRYATPLFWLCVVVQIMAAAFGGFYAADKLNAQSNREDEFRFINEKSFDHGFGFHVGFGYIIFIAAVVLFVIALGARVGRPRIWWYLAVPVLVIVQILLAWASEDVPGIGFLHGLNALIIFGLAGSLSYRQWARQAVEADVAATGGGAGTPR